MALNILFMKFVQGNGLRVMFHLQILIYTYLRLSFMWLDENVSNIANVYIQAQKGNCICFASLIIRVVSLILRSRMKKSLLCYGIDCSQKNNQLHNLNPLLRTSLYFTY